MKSYFVLLLAVALISATGCQKDVNVQKVMENEAQRKEVFDIIIQNPEMHKQLMSEHMKSGKMEMMMDKDKMHKGMMMKNDSAETMGGMNKTKMHQMMENMRQKGVMDEACYQQVMMNMKKMDK
ncbi:hypothetical protein [uncultured Pontibacter sp.]|uniref:hypothetical protein n=1 Tax=uncultured Pontibacter sp. TaxID=453356 RepID=UPI0026250B57|nr:hypothetical protein [uncultured Pontibacter sp.]